MKVFALVVTKVIVVTKVLLNENQEHPTSQISEWLLIKSATAVIKTGNIYIYELCLFSI